MLVEEYIEQVKPFLIKLFEDDSSGHDYWHLERTKNLALTLQEKEGGDRIVIGLAAYLHDIHRIMQNEMGRFVEPKESIPKVREILANTDLDEETVDKICFVVENHEIYSWHGNNVDDINTLIVQDADNLDASGAIGIGRCFSYGGSNKMPMYDPTIPLSEDYDFTESKNDPSSIHHFYHKLMKLEETMNTDTAKEMAKSRVQFIRDFAEEFLDEWNGKK
jgi:uncharacterized protein